MTDFIELFGGERASAIITAVVAAYFLFSLFPVYWPAGHVIRRKATFPRRLLFIFVISTIVYGVFSFLTYALRIPLLLYSSYIEPTLANAGLLGGLSVGWHIDRHIELYGVFLAVPLQVLITVLLTRWLSLRWSAVTQAIAT